MDIKDRYEELELPSWAPPASVFGIVWSVLYVFIAIAIVISISQPLVFALILLNLVFNFAFIPVQRLHVERFTLLIVASTLASAIAVMLVGSPTIALLFLPYVVWLAFATLLQLSVVRLNR